jgi:hypothetical protein
MAALASQPQDTERQVWSRLPSTLKRLPDLTPPLLQGELHISGLLADMPNVTEQQRVQGPSVGSDFELQVMDEGWTKDGARPRNSYDVCRQRTWSAQRPRTPTVM